MSTEKIDIEARFIADILIDATLDRLNASRGLSLSAFDNHKHREVWRRLREAETFDEVESIALSYAAVKTDNGVRHLNDRKALYLHALEVMGFDRVDEWRRSLPTGMKGDPLVWLEARRLDLQSPPPRPAPVLSVIDVPVACRGDITAILAPAKAGKSAWVGAAIAAGVVSGKGTDGEIDCLGITAGARPEHGVILLFDTEQSKPDQFDLAARAARRAGMETLPDWVICYNLVGETPAEISQAITACLAKLKANGVPVWFAVIDGIADLCTNPNDLPESQELVQWVRAHAVTADCPFIVVIHRNEGREADASARGHLGKELARKAAFNLTLEKDSEEVTTVFSTKNRGAPILKDKGPRFVWSNEAGMHVSTASKTTLREAEEIDELNELAEEVFSGGRLRYAEACQKIKVARDVEKKAAQKWFTRIRKAKVIQNVGEGFWERRAS